MFPYLYTALDIKRLMVLVQSHFPIIYGLNKPSKNAYFSMVLSYKIGSGGVEKYYKLLLKQLKNDLLLTWNSIFNNSGLFFEVFDFI